jgi:hypothetical protein
LPQPQYEALARAAARRPSSTGAFDVSHAMKQGEHHHRILQALCRSAVRGCIEGRCPPTQAYIIASKRTGASTNLEQVFPGATIVEWQPVPKGLSGRREQAASDYIIKRLTDTPDAHVKFSEVRQHADIKDVKYFRLMRRRPAFVAELERHGIAERERGFKKSVHIYFPLTDTAANDQGVR